MDFFIWKKSMIVLQEEKGCGHEKHEKKVKMRVGLLDCPKLDTCVSPGNRISTYLCEIEGEKKRVT